MSGGTRISREAVVRIRACLALACLIVLLPLPVAADLGGFEIARFHTELTIRADGELRVEERIDVDFSRARRGIYRTIPVRYTDRFGIGYSFELSHVEVTDGSGRTYTTRVRREGRYVNIRIGDPDRTVRGAMLYVIRYRVRGALRHFDEYDELYWNATGHEWNTHIREASAVVHLPSALPKDSLVVLAYVGTVGSREESAEITRVEPGAVFYDVTRGLRPREGLTVVAAWPRGHVRVPGSMARANQLVADNWILVAPLIFVYAMWRAYRRYGRDPETRSVAVQYEPPPGVSPGGVGTIVDEKVDLRDITATIVDLAVRGHIKIETEELSQMWGLKKKDVTVFERLHAGDTPSDDGSPTQDSPLRDHEQRVLNGLFASGTRVTTHDLREKFYRNVPGIKKALYRHLTREKLFAANPSTVRTKYVFGGFIVGGLVFGLGAAWAVWRGGILPYALFVPGAAGVATWLAFAAFSPAMPRRTRKGARMRAWAQGFQEFAQRVEEPRLDTLDARAVFESLLPYAIALGVSASWARRFEGIYADEPPRWFAGHHSRSWASTHAFESSLTDAMSTAEQSILTSPRSSGSGGGGFSGGGGGGGGGGSW